MQQGWWRSCLLRTLLRFGAPKVASSYPLRWAQAVATYKCHTHTHELPLQRIWCLFEVHQTICLNRSGRFEGLLLCTSTGVLQKGKAGTDVAVAVAKTAVELDTRSAQATAEEDRLMIHSLIEQMPGGLDAMNTFVRNTIRKALEVSHLHYENTLQTLMRNLSSQDFSAQTDPLPTILTSAACQPVSKTHTN